MSGSARRLRKQGDELVDRRFVKALSHPVRVRILIELDRGPMSPTEYVDQFGGNLENVSYHFRTLLECDCIKKVEARRVRGVVETFYENTQKALFSEEQFSALPNSVRSGFSATILTTFMDAASEALVTNKLDSHDSRHLTWQRLSLDEEGFARVMSRLDQVYDWLLIEQMAAGVRMKRSGEAPVNTIVAMFGFECPQAERDHDLPSDVA
jgi:DNA-binding transcriptional ArsR family regulator